MQYSSTFVLLCSLNLCAAQADAQSSANSAAAKPGVEERDAEFETVSLQGRIVWLEEALKDQFGITSVPEVSKRSLALLTKEGELYPLVENVRGRAFRTDERLRKMDLELRVRRYAKQPFVQIVRVFQIENGKRFELDYWCDVCAIVMYETGPCSCCQDDNRLRKTEIKSPSLLPTKVAPTEPTLPSDKSR